MGALTVTSENVTKKGLLSYDMLFAIIFLLFVYDRILAENL